jgi:glycosyltransferase involved in cell wall biosynthesis
LRRQDYPASAFEILVVDNSSTDHTRLAVERLLAEPGAPVRYIYENRLGITFARNKGAEAARFPYLVYIDDDCSIEPGWLSRLMKGFDMHDQVVAVGGRVVLAWDRQKRPTWFGPELEPWMGATNGQLGAQPRLMEKNARVRECNMALTREAWRESGGFLGMEQFGSENMAAGEVIYLLKQIERSKKKVTFIPEAVVHHHVSKLSWRRMFRRAYWQGISDGILDSFLNKRSAPSTLGRGLLDFMAMAILFGLAGFAHIRANRTRGAFHLLRAVRRLGLVLSEWHISGVKHHSQMR